MQFTQAIIAFAALALSVSAAPTDIEDNQVGTGNIQCTSGDVKCCTSDGSLLGLNCLTIPIIGDLLNSKCSGQQLCCSNNGSGDQTCTTENGINVDVPISILS